MIVARGGATDCCHSLFISFLCSGFDNFVASPYFLTRGLLPAIIGNQSAPWGQQEMLWAADSARHIQGFAL